MRRNRFQVEMAWCVCAAGHDGWKKVLKLFPKLVTTINLMVIRNKLRSKKPRIGVLVIPVLTLDSPSSRRHQHGPDVGHWGWLGTYAKP